jgi:hypothetical protein
MGIFKGLMGLFEAKPRSQDRIWKKDVERKKPGARRPQATVETMREALKEEKRPVPLEESPQGGMIPVQYPEIRTDEMDLMQHALNMEAAALGISGDTARMQQMLGLQQQQMSPYWKQQYGQLGQSIRFPGQPLGDFWRPGGGGGK